MMMNMMMTITMAMSLSFRVERRRVVLQTSGSSSISAQETWSAEWRVQHGRSSGITHCACCSLSLSLFSSGLSAAARTSCGSLRRHGDSASAGRDACAPPSHRSAAWCCCWSRWSCWRNRIRCVDSSACSSRVTEWTEWSEGVETAEAATAAAVWWWWWRSSIIVISSISIIIRQREVLSSSLSQMTFVCFYKNI